MDHSEKRPNIALFPGRQVRMTSFGIVYAHGDSETTIISVYRSGREGGALEQAIIYIVSSNLMPIMYYVEHWNIWGIFQRVLEDSS